MDKDGFLFIVDRLKELIKYKGYQVAPASLEDIILRHHAVADVGVVGVPDEEAGELPIAYVVKKLGMHVSEKDLQDFVAGKFKIIETGHEISNNKVCVIRKLRSACAYAQADQSLC